MSKFATKAAANMFCQARYEAAKSNERLSSREGAAEEIGIDRTRLARIELGSTIPYQEEVLLMADCYKAPELKGNYCREMCPLGKNMPKIENTGLDRISLRMLSSLKKINEASPVAPLAISIELSTEERPAFFPPGRIADALENNVPRPEEIRCFPSPLIQSAKG